MNVRTLLILLLCGGLTTATCAQSFSSGSNGSYGPINITANTTLDLPPDGIFHATTITIAEGVTLTFNRNALNTPVYLLATGDVTINGNLHVNGLTGSSLAGGLAGPGGFPGGNPGSVSTPPGAGQGPGGGRGGAHSGNQSDSAGPGAYATAANIISQNKGTPYGSALLLPLVGGSGGGGTEGTPGRGGAGGGGAILIASSTRIDLGNSSRAINATGGASASPLQNGGSGGAIRLVAPIITGNGYQLLAFGNWSGGDGRIRIDTLDRSALNVSLNPAASSSLGSMMVVFPDPMPRLDVVEAAGTAIPVGSGPVFINLPFGSTPERTVKVRAANFNSLVPISVVLTPDHGTPISYEAEINNLATNPAEVTVNVTFPVNVQTAVHAWTR